MQISALLLGLSMMLVKGLGREWIVYPEDRRNKLVCEGTNQALMNFFGPSSVAQHKRARRGGVTEFWRVDTDDWLVTKLPGQYGVSRNP